jgi:hypothetical protein
MLMVAVSLMASAVIKAATPPRMKMTTESADGKRNED